jgi:pimeloyl-ACP methyl ester carboxylesterase
MGADPVPISFHFAEVNGIRLHYARAGQGRLILFAHGFPEFWFQWRRQLDEFERDFLVAAPDLRGYNLSDKPTDIGQYEISFIVDDLRALAAHLGQEKFVLVGHDWGGVMCWVLAARYPQAVEKLVILNAPHPAVFARELRENAAQREASQYVLLFRSSAAEGLLSSNNFAVLEERVLGDALRRNTLTESERQAYLEAWSRPGALTGGLNYYRALRPDAATLEELSSALDLGMAVRVTVPTLVIWGEQDRALLTGNLSGIEEFVPNVRVHRIPDASHWVVQEQPDVVNRLIREFVESPVA